MSSMALAPSSMALEDAIETGLGAKEPMPSRRGRGAKESSRRSHRGRGPAPRSQEGHHVPIKDKKLRQEGHHVPTKDKKLRQEGHHVLHGAIHKNGSVPARPKLSSLRKGQ